jgi:hypothetical protein
LTIQTTDVAADYPGMTLRASQVAGSLDAGDLADTFTVVLGPGDSIHLTLGSAVNMGYAQLELRLADGTFIDETDLYPQSRVIGYTVPAGTAEGTYMLRMEHLTNTSVPADYDSRA